MNKDFEVIDGRCVIPEGVKVIDPGAFCDCISLKSVTIPGSVECIGSQAFSWCYGLEEVTISDGVSGIERDAFYGCKRLSSVMIPKSVRTIHPAAFAACPRLENIVVDEGNPVFKSVSNCCLTKDGRTLVCGCKTSVIPAGVGHISDYAFMRSFALRSIEIPEGVESIGYWAFFDCASLKSISLPSSLKEIDETAFAGCPLKRIRLSSPDPDGCVGLEESLCSRKLGKVSLYVPDEALGAYNKHPFFKQFKNISGY